MTATDRIRPLAVLAVTIGALVLGSQSDLPAITALLTAAAVVTCLWRPEGGRSKQLAYIGIGLVLCACASFLPYHWFKPIPWREALTNDLAVPLPYSLTPQPWITAEYLVLLISSLVWFGYLRRCNWSSSQRRLLIHGLMGTLTTLALVSTTLQWKEIPWPWGGKHSDQFSPFANRNQLAAMCTLNAALHGGGLLASFRKGRYRRAFILTLGLLVSFLTLIFIGSRAGILLAAISLPILFALQSIPRRSPKTFVIACSVILFGFAALFLSQTRLSDRLNNPQKIAQSLQDGRLAIYRDTLSLTESQPLSGHGLGNFAAIFPFSRNLSLSEYEIRHPESDWLWWWVELGWPFVLLLATAVLFLWPSLPKLARPRHTRPYDHGLKLGLLTGALIIGLHSLVDVPLHRIGSLWPFLLTVGLLFASDSSRKSEASEKTRVWLALGPALAALALCFLVPVSAVERAPLRWQSYFKRAQETLRQGGPSSEALEDFQIARTLEPHLIDLPLTEAEWWLRHDERYVLTAWHEVLKRDPKGAVSHYDRFLKRSKQTLQLESTWNGLVALADFHPTLHQLYVSHQSQTKR